MSKVNCLRKGCKEVFNAFLVENAVYDGLRRGEVLPCFVESEVIRSVYVCSRLSLIGVSKVRMYSV